MNDREKEMFVILGNNIRGFREERNMTVKELAELTGYRPEYLRKIEAGKAYGISSSCIFIFAKAFGLEPHEVVEGL